MANKSEKSLALRTIIGSLAAIIIVYVLLAVFSHQVAGNFKNDVYVWGFTMLSISFIVISALIYIRAEKINNDNGGRLFIILIALAIIIWASAWVVGSNEKVEPGSPQLEDVR